MIFEKFLNFDQLNEIHTLTHDTFVESGLITPNANGMLDLYPHLNTIDETIIVVAKENDKIIATNSITVDSEAGLHTDNFFKKETDEIRKQYPNIASSWRIATDKNYRGNIRLILSLIKKTVQEGEKRGITHCLFVFAARHERIYQKLIGATTIATKTCHVDASSEHQTKLVLMIAEMNKVKQHLFGLSNN